MPCVVAIVAAAAGALAACTVVSGELQAARRSRRVVGTMATWAGMVMARMGSGQGRVEPRNTRPARRRGHPDGGFTDERRQSPAFSPPEVRMTRKVVAR